MQQVGISIPLKSDITAESTAGTSIYTEHISIMKE